MPVWSNTATPPGPLNYRQIQEVIAFIRATSEVTYTMRDPELGTPEVDPVTGEVKTFQGWVDTTTSRPPGARRTRPAGPTSSPGLGRSGASGVRSPEPLGVGRPRLDEPCR